MGHRPRGLQRERRRLELLPSRPRAIARLPLGRRRTRGLFRSEAAAVFRGRALERERPDSQGAPLWPQQRRRQPRRGREGVLLLSRFHADPFVHEVAVQISARGVPVRTISIQSNARRTRQDYEYELIDTGVFDEDRYFDVVVEYAKSSPEECFVQITVTNRGPETAAIHVLPTLWFRNTWSWWPGPEKPILTAAKAPRGTSLVAASHPELGARWLYCDGAPSLLFTENETNNARLFASPNATAFVKDAFHAFVVNGDTDAVNPAQAGTKAAANYRLEVGAGQSVSVRLCLTDTPAADAICGVRHRRSPPGARRRTSSIAPARPSPRARIRPRSCARPLPACSGPSSTTSSTSTCGFVSTA